MNESLEDVMCPIDFDCSGLLIAVQSKLRGDFAPSSLTSGSKLDSCIKSEVGVVDAH